jgi:type IV secretory pathway TrbF-like protein
MTKTAKEHSLPTIPAEPDAAFEAGKRLYAEQWGDAVVTNTYLKFALFAVSLLCVGCMVAEFKLIKHIDGFKPLVIRIDEVGRAEAVKYDTLTYKPKDAEIKYFLSEFCRLYYSRNRFTIHDNFKGALLYMDSQLADTTMQAWNRAGVIGTFMQSSQGEQTIQVSRVEIEDLRAAPYKATVMFDIVTLNPIDRSEARRQHYTAHFIFSFRDSVPNNLIQTNPLGMAVSYFREDEAFN